MIDIGTAIKKARKSAGLTCEELGKKLGVSGTTISRYETNQRKVSIPQLEEIASALGITLGSLLDGNSKKIDRLDKQKWREDALVCLRRLSELKEELSILQEECDLLEHKVQFYMKQGVITDRDLSSEE